MAQNSNRKQGLLALWHNHPFSVHIATLFSVLVFLACAAIVGANYVQGRNIVLAAAESLFDRIHRETANEIVTLRAPLEAVVSVLGSAPITDAESFESRMQTLPALVDVLDRDNRIAAIYIGYQNGDFFLLRALRDAALRKQFDAPRHAQYALQSIERRDGPKPRWLLLDAALNTISERSPPDYTFDPRVRPWYGDAIKAQKVVVTAPYVFATTGNVGITVARRAEHGRAVVGADIDLEQISKSLQKNLVTPASQIALYDGTGGVVAHSDPRRASAQGANGKPVLAKITDTSPILAAGAANAKYYAKSARLDSGGHEWMMKVATIDAASDRPYQLVVAAPLDELLAESRRLLLRNLLIALVIVAVTVPLSWWMARRIAGNLKALTDQAAAIRKFDFSEYPLPQTRIKEVHRLGRAMQDMRKTIERFLEVSMVVAAEDRFERLLPRLLKEMISTAGARSGVMYLSDATGLLKAGAAEVRGLPQELTQAVNLTLDEAPAVLRDAVTRGCAVAGSIDAGESQRCGLALLTVASSNAVTHGMAIPLFNRNRQLLGALLLCTEERVDDALVSFVSALSGLAAVSLETQERAKAMTLVQDKLDAVVQNGIQISRERDRQKLLREILFAVKELCHCDQGTMYLKTEHGTLQFALRTAEGELPSFEIPLTDAATGLPNEKFVSTYVALKNKTVLIDDVYSETRFDLSGTRRFSEESGYRTISMLTVPMSPREGEVLGVLQFMNALDPDTGKVIPFPAVLVRIVEALAAQSAVALENQNLLQAQKALLESLIGLVAGAIDAKSPYTGGHCQRVPELTKMLARAACDAKEGPFASFNIDENGWEALHIAGWLHDCGKVTTPEYVVDKATKLETIYDRIHEIRTRFEVLKRDAEIACLKAIAAGGNAVELRTALADQLSTLDDEYAFVAVCNEGGEFMAPEKIVKLRSIGARTWQRTLNDRLGVSWEEARRMAYRTAPALPTTEYLLSDKVEHVIERGPQDLMPEDNPWGFKLKVPASRYNRGELYNLSVARGTLTEEERYKINDHIVQTIVMLSQLPFPGHLRAVPELAGGHHEKMDGTGYPKQLLRDQMSVQARIMAIADIFEALTAIDRPYKKGKKLSEAIEIMSFMNKDQHIDSDLFELFLTSGVYKDYATRFLKPEFIDDVDISVYVGRPQPQAVT